MEPTLGDIAASIADIRGILLVMQIDISDLKADVAVLKTDMSGVKADVAALKTDMSGVKADIIRIDKRIDALDKKVESYHKDFIVYTQQDSRFLRTFKKRRAIV